MTPPRLSVIVVSRHRPAALLLCLTGLAQSDHPAMEVIVVADPAACAAVAAAGWADRIRLLPFDEANIAAARNLGLAQAAGTVVAFIDDDAVPEPTWASRLAAPFAHPRVGAAGGFVRGRNGISFQWRALAVDHLGQDHPLEVDPEGVSLHEGTATRAVKTQGTNCAFRRAALLAAGGFDPAFRFYLDEADVNLRLAAAGHLTAVVPRAEVIHGFAASARRRADRVPADLTDIGASTAVFLRRHAPGADHGPALAGLRAEQRRRLIAHMLAGRLDPGAVAPLLRGLESGIAQGFDRALAPLRPLAGAGAAFLPLPGTGPRPGRLVLSAGLRPDPRAEADAAAARAGGAVVTLLRLLPGPRRHRLWLRPDGIWEQRGGLWGASLRSDPALRLWRPADRALREAARLEATRPVA